MTELSALRARYGDPFAAGTLAADLVTIRGVLERFFASVRPDQWQNRTGRHRHDWTLREVLAHITAAAEIFNLALESTLRGERFEYEGLTHRGELGLFNQREIAARQRLAPDALIWNLLDALSHTAQVVQCITPDELATSVYMYGYVRPMTLAHLIAGQIGHPGLVHAAQIPRAVGAPPFWKQYPVDLMHRMLARILMQASYAYWPDRGGNLRAVVQFKAGGDGGGAWSMRVSPDGGEFSEGQAHRPDLTIWTRTPDALCRMLTSSASSTVFSGQVIAYGKLWIVPRLTRALVSVG